MEETEIRLKELIIEKYGNIKKFCEVIDMPWTTLDSILKRGISKANIINIMKITKELGLDTEELAHGNIVYKREIKSICDISSDEYNLIQKYRALHKDRKTAINTIIDDEFEKHYDIYYQILNGQRLLYELLYDNEKDRNNAIRALAPSAEEGELLITLINNYDNNLYRQKKYSYEETAAIVDDIQKNSKTDHNNHLLDAAHEICDASDEDKKHDEKIMNDENF